MMEKDIFAGHGVFSEFEHVRDLCVTWRCHLKDSGTFPRFEEVALGSLGVLADDLGLIGQGRAGNLEIYYAGRSIENWLGQELRCTPLDEIDQYCAGPLRDTLALATRRRAPATQVLHCLRNGLATSREIVIFPLTSKKGATVFLLFSRERAKAHNIIDAIYRATDDGLVTLAAIKDEDGNAILDFRLLSLNDGAARLFGGSETELRWRLLSEVAPAFSSDGALARLIEISRNKRCDEFEVSAPAAGAARHLRLSAAPMGNDLIAITLTDITRLKSREEYFRLLFEDNPVPMWLHDPRSQRVLAVNDAAIRHFGFSREAFLGAALETLFDEREWPALASIKGGEAGPCGDRVWQGRKADGQPIDIEIYARSLDFEGRSAILVSVVDMTEQLAAQERIAHMALHDPLTGLANRAQFRMRLAAGLETLRPGEALAAHYIDLDDFKDVNDTLGHPAGDELLVAVARRLAEILPPGDLVARLGGDEFAFLQFGLQSQEDAAAFAEKIVGALGRTFEIDGQEVLVGASVGVAVAPMDAMDPDALLQYADIALYEVKQEGGDAFRLFDSGMAAALIRRRVLEADLRDALAHNAFELYYQPIAEIESGRIVATEALLRWTHPLRGPISPAEFIPIAEASGLIVPIGDMALRLACAEAVRWPESTRLCVNLSPAQFKSQTLVQSVVRALEASGLPASRLELEITETVLLEENRDNLSILHRLRALGVRISLDDFGTGNSSLSYLRAFPFDKIKIDRSFVKDLPTNPQCVAIVRAVTGIGQCLDVAIVAEGVETEEQLAHLRKEGCTQMQGYLFARPQPAEMVRKLFGAPKEDEAAA
jgi:diguanylate cyclase (GGDEF)-like protein/PAS domain S-box-containing protein